MADGPLDGDVLEKPAPDAPAAPAGPDAPLEERLRFGSDLHRKILGRLNSRRELSERHISKRYDDWDRTDEHVRLFIDLSRKARKGDRTDDPSKKEMPFERAVVVPMSLAILLVRLTQLVSIFTSREPLIQLEGRGPEDVRPAKLMEAVLAYDLQQTASVLVLYAFLQDAEKYGMGVIFDAWEEEPGWVVQPAPRLPPGVAQMLRLLGMPLTPKRTWGTVREFNLWEPVDPFQYWPDPRVPVSAVQQGEFVGHRTFRGEMHLRERSQESGGPFFNLEFLDKIAGASGQRRATSRNRFAQEQFSLRGSPDPNDKGFFTLDHIQVKLMPRDWKLDEGDRPEIWWFTVVDETLIVRAHRASFAHGRFTYSVGESIPDAHALFNPGMIENLDGLQRLVNWMVGCYSADTEILTPSGWKLFADLTPAHQVSTVDPITGRLSFEVPRRLIALPHTGDMVQIGGGPGSRLDLCVTPNHRMWVAKRINHRAPPLGRSRRTREVGDFHWRTADELVHGEYRIKASVTWEGVEEGTLVFEAIPPVRKRGHRMKYPERRIPYDLLAPFLGYYVSEGSIARKPGGTYMASLRQKKPAIVAKIDALMARWPGHVCRSVDRTGAVSWLISDKRLGAWLHEETGKNQPDRRAPEIVHQFGPGLLRAFVEAAIDGDGTRPTATLATYASPSPRLADDMQICALKLGWNATVSRDPYPEGRDMYRVNMSTRGTPLTASSYVNIRRVPYAGTVYCVENSTHLVLVRRNGRVAVCGQSHAENIRKHLNDALILAPTLVEMQDVVNPGPARHIRLSAQGEKMLLEGRLTSVQAAVQQLALTDVTSQHLRTANQFFDMAQRMAATSDPQMSQPTDDKRTLGEVQQILAASSQRMAMSARLLDVAALQPLALRSVANRQQFTRLEQYFRIAGDLARELGGVDRLLIAPSDLAGALDYVPHSGLVPQDPARFAEVWIRLLTEGAKLTAGGLSRPDGRRLDIGAIFDEAARTAGIKNVNEFWVTPDALVQAQAQAGNVVPAADVELGGNGAVRGAGIQTPIVPGANLT